jgi:hypothetical protein
LHDVDNINKYNNIILNLTNVTCSAFPFRGATAHIGIPQVLAGATITASTPITVAVLQVACFPLPPITTCTQEISYTVCAASIVPTGVGRTFVFIYGIKHKQFCCDTKFEIIDDLSFCWGGIIVYKQTKYYVAQLY